MIKTLLKTSIIISMTLSMAVAKEVTDHAGNTVDIPDNPKRIASMHTMSTTVMLWDLGAPLIGTATRIKKDENNRPYIRGVEEVYGVKFQDTDLVNFGKFGGDIEQVKKSKPDLIVATTKNVKVYDNLSAIAPTVIIDYRNPKILGVYKDLASWIGKEKLFAEKEKKYLKRLHEVRSKFSVSPSKQTIAYVTARKGKAQYSARLYYGGVTQVAYDLGFEILPFLVEQFGIESQGGNLSAETFGKMNADWLISTYRNQIGETVEDIYTGFDEIAPGWRSYTPAYKNKQFITLERETSYPCGFKSLHLILDGFEKNAK